ncbi:DUF4232 domain-containing protein [Pseudarthrobacter albicanus]|uniref:DUF4232 domain-containing protein n=1 Tax=Pseudarthrobacter albicanus TaxID=2823873 RepID=UPI001BA57CCB|nr:DUF4232 domain-containing protein [Pseudarthrobacter albicanus]
MRPQRTKNILVLTTAAAAAALLLSGCGAGAAQPQSTTGPAAPTASASSPSNSSGASADESASAPSSAPPGAQPTTQSGPALCKAAGLTASTDSTGGGAAGSVYQQLILTNSGTGPCLLKGYAGVSLTADANGEPIGAPATRDESIPVTDVLLAPGQAGTAVLRYTQAANYTDCTRVPAAGLRIYPPEDTASLFLAQPRDACSNAGINLLIIEAFQAK